MSITEGHFVPLDTYKKLVHDAEMWQKHKDSFKVLQEMLDVASPLVLNKLKVEDAVRDSQENA